MVCMASNGPHSRPPRRAHCVVWSADGPALPAALARALDRPDMSLARAHDRFAALAMVGSRDLADGPAVLLLVGPERLNGLGEVLRALARYARHAVVWVFDAEERRLRAITAEEHARWSGADRRAEQPGPRRHDAHDTRKHEPARPERDSALGSARAAALDFTSVSLTNDEMAVLLSAESRATERTNS